MSKMLEILNTMKNPSFIDKSSQMNLTNFKKVPEPVLKFSRIQSPSSINTWLQCPRNYYYKYVKELPTKPTLDQFRGKLLHSILEDLFDMDFSVFSKANFGFEMKMILLERLKKRWNNSEEEIQKIGVKSERVKAYFFDAQKMINNYVDYFIDSLKNLTNHFTFEESLMILTPQREQYLESKEYKVRGYLDTIFKYKDLNEKKKVVILDYKTASKNEIKKAYKNQLSIYALLYKENFNVLPDEVGIHFLMYGVKKLNVSEEMVENAVKTIKKVHKGTLSKDIKDYPQVRTPLCKWHSGQCDFYDLCYK